MSKSLFNVDLYHIASGWLLQAGVKIEAAADATEAEIGALASKVLPYETSYRAAVTKLCDVTDPAATVNAVEVPAEPADTRTPAEIAADEFVASLPEEDRDVFRAALNNSALKR